MTFKVDIDLTEAVARIDQGAARGLHLATEFLLTEANKSVPHQDGTLERSGRTSVDATAGRGAVSYDTPYAVPQHERMDYHHDGKGEAKWLENTMTREASQVAELIAAAIRREVEG